MQMPDPRFEKWPLSRLKGWDKNPREAEPADLERLKAQLLALKPYKPLLVAEDGTVLGGNMRLKVLQEMGVEDVWVSVVVAPDDKTKTEYALSDNDRAGFYDRARLQSLLADLPDFRLEDFKVDLGYTTGLDELGKLDVKVDLEVDKNTMDEKLERYQNATIKQVVLYFKAEEFDDVLARLETVMEGLEVDNHTEAFLHILDFYENQNGRTAGD